MRSIKVRGIWILAIVLLVWAITSTSVASYYYMKYTEYYGFHQYLLRKLKEVSMSISIAIDYGNGTILWYNNTLVPLGCDLLNATKTIADVQSTYWLAYSASFVDAINGVSKKHPYYWMWLYWDQNEKTWKYGPVGADRYILKPDETIMWRYEIPSW